MEKNSQSERILIVDGVNYAGMIGSAEGAETKLEGKRILVCPFRKMLDGSSCFWTCEKENCTCFDAERTKCELHNLL